MDDQIKKYVQYRNNDGMALKKSSLKKLLSTEKILLKDVIDAAE